MMKQATGVSLEGDKDWMVGRIVAEITAIQDEMEATGKPATDVITEGNWKKRLDK